MAHTRIPAARMDATTRLMTVVTSGLLAVVIPLWVVAEAVADFVPWLAVATGVSIVILAFGFAPAGFEVATASASADAPDASGNAATPEPACQVIIHRRLFGTRSFPVTGEVGLPTWQMGFGGMRLGGSSGLFGWYGRFWKPDVGRYYAYLTDRTKLVSVETSSGLVLVSPADREGFAQAIEEARRST